MAAPRQMRIYRVNFKGINPVGNCLIIAAYNVKQARTIAKITITHTKKFKVKRATLIIPGIIEYLSGDY